MREYAESGASDVLLTHNRYMLVDRRNEELLDLVAERGMGVFNAAPSGGGILAGRSETARNALAPCRLARGSTAPHP
ncbi:hypothetical protein ABT174_32360 [Streptomyces sparsogenes]|uniref:hypothetical protein n=1 Tax=Streptomyces sparsogenes TaxID=67365 RepID=UPI00332B6668